jgi:hypothetical protein
MEGWIADRYAEILGVLPWSRTHVQAILRTTAPYDTGTVAVTEGSASVTLAGGTWTSGMSGRAFRVGTRNEFYEFTYASASTGTLDRVYEGPDDAAADYTVFQNVYPLPSDCRLLEDDAFATFELGPLQRFSRTELNASQPVRSTYGTPEIWASYMEDGSTPPRMQVELYPIPDAAIGIPFTYVAEGTALTTTSQILQVWIQPAALLEGVTAKIKRHLKDYLGANEHDKQAGAALALMVGAEAQGMDKARMQLDPYYTSHRSRRANR